MSVTAQSGFVPLILTMIKDRVLVRSNGQHTYFAK